MRRARTNGDPGAAIVVEDRTEADTQPIIRRPPRSTWNGRGAPGALRPVLLGVALTALLTYLGFLGVRVVTMGNNQAVLMDRTERLLEWFGVPPRKE